MYTCEHLSKETERTNKQTDLKKWTRFSFLIQIRRKRSKIIEEKRRRKKKYVGINTQKRIKNLVWTSIFYKDRSIFTMAGENETASLKTIHELFQMWKTWIAWMRVNESRLTVMALSSKSRIFVFHFFSPFFSSFKQKRCFRAEMSKNEFKWIHYYRIRHLMLATQ